MTTIDTDGLRRLADAAADGPWEFPSEILGLPNPSIFAGDPKRGQVAHVALSGGANAEFIAAAREAIPALLDALAQAEARIKAVEDVLDSIDTSTEPVLHDGFADIRRALDGDS